MSTINLLSETSLQLDRHGGERGSATRTNYGCQNASEIAGMAVDPRSEKNIKTLNPKVQPLARKLIERAVEQGIHVKIICGARTREEQDAIYAKGRTKPGPIVTKAKGGTSLHETGVAFDVGIFSKDGKKYFGESSDYEKVGQIGRGLGLSWGGDWKEFKDFPHFQYTEGRTLAELTAAYKIYGDALA